MGREADPSMILSDSSQMTYLKYIQAAGASYVLHEAEVSFSPWVEKLTLEDPSKNMHCAFLGYPCVIISAMCSLCIRTIMYIRYYVK